MSPALPRPPLTRQHDDSEVTGGPSATPVRAHDKPQKDGHPVVSGLAPDKTAHCTAHLHPHHKPSCHPIRPISKTSTMTGRSSSRVIPPMEGPIGRVIADTPAGVEQNSFLTVQTQEGQRPDEQFTIFFSRFDPNSQAVLRRRRLDGTVLNRGGVVMRRMVNGRPTSFTLAYPPDIRFPAPGPAPPAPPNPRDDLRSRAA